MASQHELLSIENGNAEIPSGRLLSILSKLTSFKIEGIPNSVNLF